MKLYRFIRRLQEAQQQYGPDLPVFVEDEKGNVKEAKIAYCMTTDSKVEKIKEEHILIHL